MNPQPTGKHFTRAERSWIAYDWANSAYATIVMAAVFPIYFANVAAGSGVSGDVWWGYGSSAATLAVAVLAPVLGAIADFRGMKKRLFAAFLLIGLVFTASMALTDNWQMMLVGYVFSYIGYSGSLLFYDAFITDVTTPQRMDNVSAWGYAMGYIGGSTIPFILSIVLILFGGSFGIDGVLAVKLSVVICVVWWAGFSLPMLRDVRQVHYEDKPASDLIRSAFRGIARTFREILANKVMLAFMIAYFFYIDGVNTVIHMATVYGSSLGLGSTGMILALLVTQVVAVPFSIIFSHLAKRFGSIRMITTAMLIYVFICIVGFFMGFTLEPYQAAYRDDFRQTLQATLAQSGRGSLPASDQTALASQVTQLLESSDTILADADRSAAFVELASAAGTRLAAQASDPTSAAGLQQIVASLIASGQAFLTDQARAADFDRALARSTLLFWAMAALVGTVQGGIQALSRSFFGKLIPPRRSNEFFGFFDIFGKFATVTGPALYSLIANLSGRSSFGILSLILLFTVGLTTIAFNRRHLKEAEIHAANRSEGGETA